LNREAQTYDFNAWNKPDQQTYEVGGTATATMNLTSVALDSHLAFEKLRKLESRNHPACVNRPFLINHHDRTLVPTEERPIAEALLTVTPFVGEGGEANTGREYDNDFPAMDVEYVKTRPAVAQSLATGTATASAIPLTWDVDTERYLRQTNTLRVLWFDVYQSALGPGTGPYVKVSGGTIADVDAAPNPTDLGRSHVFRDTLKVNGALAVGDTTMDFDGGLDAGTTVVGDTFYVTGSSKRYTMTNAQVATSGAVTGATFTPALDVAIPDDAPIVEYVPNRIANVAGSSGSVEYTATGLTTATPYYYVVVTYDQYGMSSVYSTEVTATTL
jgi:hypothetical protein